MFAFTEYFAYTRKRKDRASINDEYIEYVIDNYEKEEIQQDGRIRRWAFIDKELKYLRVIMLPDGKTVHNAFFDRTYKG
ncbi:MAG TPA: hypothetical protein PL073_09930 [Spirochaetota bacterium]|nr:hypothetical protein [Spirochaetota bacterium]